MLQLHRVSADPFERAGKPSRARTVCTHKVECRSSVNPALIRPIAEVRVTGGMSPISIFVYLNLVFAGLQSLLEKALELVRAMVAQNPSLLGADDVKRPVGTGRDSLPTDSVQIDLKEVPLVDAPE